MIMVLFIYFIYFIHFVYLYSLLQLYFNNYKILCNKKPDFLILFLLLYCYTFMLLCFDQFMFRLFFKLCCDKCFAHSVYSYVSL